MPKLSKSFHTIIFLDIDGTLIDVRQRANSNQLPAIIQRLARKGFRFGLNSNRSLEDVIPFVRQFGLTGPFILENGAYTLSSLESRKTRDSSLPSGAKKALKDVLARVIQKHFPQFALSYADTTSLVRRDRWPKGRHFFANTYRSFTASVHNRTNGKPSLAISKRLAQELNRELRKEHLSFRAVAHFHGMTVTISPKNIDKKTGLRHFTNKRPALRTIAIGNDETDASLRDEIDELYAVGNATRALKRVADGVAKAPLTRGVIEILTELERRQQK